MKKLIASIAALAALSSIAGVAHADVTHLTSRHDTTSELKRLEQAGYNPAHNSNNYPDDIQDAEAKIHAQDGVAANGAAVDNSGYGNASSATSQGGNTAAHVGVRGGLYSHN